MSITQIGPGVIVIVLALGLLWRRRKGGRWQGRRGTAGLVLVLLALGCGAGALVLAALGH